MRKLYVFSSNYPYKHNGGEFSFLEPEIGVLNTFFDVTMVPLSPFGENLSDHTFKVDLDYSKFCHGFNAIFSAIYGLLFFEVWTESMQLFRCRSIKCWTAFVKFLIRFGGAKRWLRRRKIHQGDILYTYWCTGTTLGLMGNPLAKTVTRAHRYDIYAEESDIKYVFGLEKVYRQIDCFVAISNDGRDYLTRKYGANRNLMVCKLGVSDKAFCCSQSLDGIFRILSVSRIAEEKRVDLVRTICDDLTKKSDSLIIEWTHIGDGEEQLVSSIRSMIGVNPRLKINLLGLLSNNDVCEYYVANSVDLFVNASSSEGIPVAIQEAMSFGVPVIAVNVGGVAEAVTEGCGFIVPPENPRQGLLEAIEMFLSLSEERRNVMRVAAKRAQQDSFNSDRNYKYFASQILGQL